MEFLDALGALLPLRAQVRYFPCAHSRGGDVAQGVLGEEEVCAEGAEGVPDPLFCAVVPLRAFSGVLLSDCYAGYCWYLGEHPAERSVAQWVKALRGVYEREPDGSEAKTWVAQHPDAAVWARRGQRLLYPAPVEELGK